MTTKYGLLGCGMMGQEHIRNIDLLTDTEVSAIFEPDASMRSLCKELAPNAFYANSLEEFLAFDAMDCIVITSPNFRHVEHLEAIAEVRTIPILCEKPLYTDPNDLERILALKENYGAPIWVAMEYRYMPPIAKFIQKVDDATGGIKMLTIQEHRFPFLEKVGDWNRFNENSGGTFVEKCCHFFDLMRHILKSDPVRIMASAGQEVNHLDEVYDGKTSDIWDCGYVIVDFASGQRAMLELSMFAEGSEFQEMISAIGPKGKLETKVPGPTRFWNTDLGPAPEPVLITSPRNPTGPQLEEIQVDPHLLIAGDHHGSTFYQHLRFLHVINGQEDVAVTLDDGAWAVRMGLAAQESARTGLAVTL